MRAAVNVACGSPEVVRVCDVQAPEPAGDEVLVRIRATTVNRTEYAGDVVAVGGRVTAFGLGDRVFGYCEPRLGAHAQLLAVPETSSIATIPEGVDLDRAAASTEGAHYARSAIRRARVQPGGRYVSTGLGPGWQNLPLSGLTPLLPDRLSGGRRVVFPLPEDGRHVVEEIGGLLASGAFEPVVDRRYGLAEIVEAYRDVETEEKVGNVVIHPGPASTTEQ